MKKSIFILALTLMAIVGFSTKSYAQNITLENGLNANVTVDVCTTNKTLVAGEIFTTSSTCGGTAPCSFDITTPCTGTITVTVPCLGPTPYTNTQTFFGGGIPVCIVNVDYTYSTSGDITIHIY